jgi:hypothetical protein
MAEPLLHGTLDHLDSESAADEVPDMGGVKRVDHLDRTESWICDAIEQPLAAAEQNGDDVQHEFIDGKGEGTA